MVTEQSSTAWQASITVKLKGSTSRFNNTLRAGGDERRTKQTKAKLAIRDACTTKSICPCMRCRGRLLAMLSGCACSICQPVLYTAIAEHDIRPIDRFTALSYRNHDPWKLACYLVDNLKELEESSVFLRAGQRWKETSRRMTRKSPFPLADSIFDQDLQVLAEVVDDLFFMGNLSILKVLVQWADLPSDIYGWLFSTPVRPIVQLNRNHWTLKRSFERIIQVIIHELIHTFFSFYACYPWTKISCAAGNCATRWQSNIGSRGHGRAWQHVAKGFEEAMPKLLGIKGYLGRLDGLLCDSGSDDWHLSCFRDAHRLYPEQLRAEWWDRMLRTKDDDVVCTSILMRRKKLTSSETSGSRQRSKSLSKSWKAHAVGK